MFRPKKVNRIIINPVIILKLIGQNLGPYIPNQNVRNKTVVPFSFVKCQFYHILSNSKLLKPPRITE